MPIEYEVSSLDGVEESLRGAYVEEGGKFKLDVDKYAELRAAPLLAKNKQLLDEKKRVEHSLKATQPDKDRIADLEREVKHYQLSVPLRDIALKAGIFPDRLDIAMLDLGKRFALGDDGQIQVLDEHGNPTSVTPEKFFDTLYKEQRPYLFKAKEAGGGSGARKGTGSVSTPAKTTTRAAFEAMGANEQMAFIREGGSLTE